MALAPDLQHFFLEGGFAFGCLWGECSLLCSFGLLCPKTTWQFFEAGRKKDLPTLWAVHKELNEFAAAVFAPVENECIDGAYDKTLARLADERFPNRLLPPYRGLTEEQFRNVSEIYDAWRARVP
jgi:hypothetical protein